MSLFKVEGWDVPSSAVVTAPSRTSKKRKRATTDIDDLAEAQVNFGKLIRKVEEDGLGVTVSKKKNKHKKEKKRDDKPKVNVPVPTDQGKEVSMEVSTRMNKIRKQKSSSTHNPEAGTSMDISMHPSKRTGPDRSEHVAAEPNILTGSTSKKQVNSNTPILTALQSRMKGRLDGAQFRWINETLYTTSSKEGHDLMRENPKLYEEYHRGFRQQIRSWPSNPVSHYVKELSSYPRGTVIADLGCGDGTLARNLIQKGYCVLSFDLVSDGDFIVESNVCERIPLPGSELSHTTGSGGQVVDVCVCALSLMGVDWIRCIRETWRILRLGGRLKIAEVTSRFTDLDQFLAIISRVGFTLKSKDDTNSHFILFEFEKISRKSLDEKDWETLQAKGMVLKPCEYKRR